MNLGETKQCLFAVKSIPMVKTAQTIKVPQHFRKGGKITFGVIFQLPITYKIGTLQAPKHSLGWKVSDNHIFPGRVLCPQPPNCRRQHYWPSTVRIKPARRGFVLLSNQCYADISLNLSQPNHFLK